MNDIHRKNYKLLQTSELFNNIIDRFKEMIVNSQITGTIVDHSFVQEKYQIETSACQCLHRLNFSDNTVVNHALKEMRQFLFHSHFQENTHCRT